jgi:hypothetical protein
VRPRIRDGRTEDRPPEEMEKGGMNGLIKDEEGGDFTIGLQKGGCRTDLRGRVRLMVIRDEGGGG